DDTGAPAQNMNITVMRFVMRGGERAQAIATGSSARTDDRGQYRVFGLPAGEYSVSAGRFIFSDEGKLHRVTPSEVDAALKPSTTSGAAPSARPVEESQPIMAASVFYPGTTIFAEAGTVEVAAGEEKSGIDITLQYVAATNIEGRLLGPDGTAPAATTLTMVEVGAPVQISQPRFARPAATTGAFAFNSIPPGQYVITARATTRPPAAGATPDAPLFARADVTVTGRAMPPITLTLEDGVTVSGIVQPDAASAGIDPRAVRVGLEPIIGRNDVAIGVQAVVPDANGAFAITGVPPGRYRVTIDTGVSGRAILPKSATLQSANALDDGIQVSGSDLSGLDVTITSLAAEISGSLQDASGRAATDFYVIVFPEDRKFWTMNSRRIKTARPGVDGTFVLRNLPPGNYRIAAVTDVDTNEWFEPTFLSQLVSASAQITLAEGEKKAFPLKLGGG
ncbi:MAG: carboxypeptidase regulatory-like domain-containing protein, partial [Acidobacteria bacterium]|nr:carboxypeptidase regulatory-like domain-containing protein [Acidobacteriota bacterium]